MDRNIPGCNTTLLLGQLQLYRVSLIVETDMTVRTTLSLLIGEVIAELGRRNDVEISRRAAGAEQLVAMATAIVTRRMA
jgi:hypothetical protein